MLRFIKYHQDWKQLQDQKAFKQALRLQPSGLICFSSHGKASSQVGVDSLWVTALRGRGGNLCFVGSVFHVQKMFFPMTRGMVHEVEVFNVQTGLPRSVSSKGKWEYLTNAAVQMSGVGPEVRWTRRLAGAAQVAAREMPEESKGDRKSVV